MGKDHSKWEEEKELGWNWFFFIFKEKDDRQLLHPHTFHHKLSPDAPEVTGVSGYSSHKQKFGLTTERATAA